MKVELKKDGSISQLVITGVVFLDPITVNLDDYEVGKGQILVECGGKIWTAVCDDMGELNLAQYLLSCDPNYMHQMLSPNGYIPRIVEVVRGALKDSGLAEQRK
ncbi:hypothetical protein ACP6H7_25040 [Vibrio harveyi]|uniref:hypothetical protein n=1 Tax=Vibrio harveyi TaxID=669 RepID=UPI003CEB2D83